METQKSTPSLSELLCNYKVYGFKSRSSMIQTALLRLKNELEPDSLRQPDEKNLRESADLYAEIYEDDKELHELTEAAIQEYPE